MRLKRRIPIIGILAVAILITGCSQTRVSDQALNGDGSRSTSGDNSLSLEAPKTSVYPGAEAYVQAFGGTPPYTYYVISGPGTIEADTGLFTADIAQGTVRIGVRDSAGKIATASFSVGSGWGNSVILTPASGTITVTQRVTLKATGGSAPYFYAVTSGPGSVSGDVYTAPATPGGTVTLAAVDSIGGTATVTYTIQAVQTLTMTPATKSMVAGTQANFVVTGGVPPYNYSVVFGGGTFTRNKYTAGLVAGPARIQVTDAQGSVVNSDITITPNYSTAHQSATFTLIVDHFLAFSYDNSTESEHPNFTFWGNGPNAVASDPGKNCPAATQKCGYVVALNNFSNTNFAYASYRGTIGMAGRSGGAQISFCIDPEDTTRAKIHWESGSGFTAEVTYNLNGKVLFSGKPTVSAFTLVDTLSGAGNATVNFDGAYTSQIDCSDFAGDFEVVVDPQ